MEVQYEILTTKPQRQCRSLKAGPPLYASRSTLWQTRCCHAGSSPTVVHLMGKAQIQSEKTNSVMKEPTACDVKHSNRLHFLMFTHYSVWEGDMTEVSVIDKSQAICRSLQIGHWVSRRWEKPPGTQLAVI